MSAAISAPVSAFFVNAARAVECPLRSEAAVPTIARVPMKTDPAVARTASTVMAKVLFFTAPPYKTSDPANQYPITLTVSLTQWRPVWLIRRDLYSNDSTTTTSGSVSINARKAVKSS